MNNKIPPPIVTLFFGCCIYFSRDYFLNVNIQWLSILSYAFFIAGITAIFLALRLFKKKETTVNPIKIETASSLVTSGIFNYTRHPMSLGMALILIGLSLKFNLIGGFVFTAFFMLFITYFQIRPEEKAMHEIFGEEFLNYKENVRMWL